MPQSRRGIHLALNPVPIYGSRIPSAATSHWVLVVWNGVPGSSHLTSELLTTDGQKFYPETKALSNWPPFIRAACAKGPIGYTDMTNDAIVEEAQKIASLHGNYHFLMNNCQDFVKRLLFAINVGSRPRGIYVIECPDGDVRIDFNEPPRTNANQDVWPALPDPRAQYRFKEEFVHMVSRANPGYITPSFNSILVNVTGTEEEAMWKGVDRTTGLTGKFAASSVEQWNAN